MWKTTCSHLARRHPLLEDRLEHGLRDVDFRVHALAAAPQHVDVRGLLVGAEVPADRDEAPAGELREQRPHHVRRRLGHPVHAHRVAGLADEAQEHLGPELVGLDVFQAYEGVLDVRAELLDQRDVLDHAAAQLVRSADVGRLDHRGARHPVKGHQRRQASGHVDGLDPALDAGHEGGFVGRERHVVVALRVLAVDPERAGDPQRDQGGTDLHLDARQDRAVRVGDVVDLARLDERQRDAGGLLDALAAQRRCVAARLAHLLRVRAVDLGEDHGLEALLLHLSRGEPFPDVGQRAHLACAPFP